MKDQLMKLLTMAVLVAVIGGVAAYGLGLVMPMITSIELVGSLLAGIIAIVLYLYIIGFSDIEVKEFGYLVPLLALVSIIGTFVVSILPSASGFILTLNEPLTWMNVLWTLIYAGIAMAIVDKFM